MRTERTEDGGGRLLVFNGDQEEFWIEQMILQILGRKS